MSLKRSLVNLAKLPSKEIRTFFDSLDVILTDCDGVLWKSNEVIDSAIEVLDRWRRLGRKVFYLTNNSTRSRDMFINRVHKLGFHCEKQDILSSAFLTAEYLKSLNFNKKVYIIGAIGIAHELDLVGIKHSEVGPDVLNIKKSIDEFVDNFQPDPEIGAVVIGYDIHISYPKIIRATTYLNKPGVLFIATNADERFPLKRTDVVLPGAASMVAAVEVIANRQPFIIGKPSTYAFDWLKKIMPIKPERTLMIGDRQLGKRIFFLTNNSTRTRDDLMAKMHNSGFECSKDEILTSCYLTAEYLKSIKFDKKVYMIGSEGLSKELDNVEIENEGCGPDAYVSSSINIHVDSHIGAVVVGLDEHLSYPKLLKACVYLADPAVLFIATNGEDGIPYDGKINVPGTGCIVKPIENCTRRSAHIIGKPNTFVCEVINRNGPIDHKRTLIIGDGCDTDILLGTRCGFQTLLVLTGVTKLEDVVKFQQSDRKEQHDLVPDFYIHSIGDLAQLFND